MSPTDPLHKVAIRPKKTKKTDTKHETPGYYDNIYSQFAFVTANFAHIVVTTHTLAVSVIPVAPLWDPTYSTRSAVLEKALNFISHHTKNPNPYALKCVPMLNSFGNPFDDPKLAQPLVVRRMWHSFHVYAGTIFQLGEFNSQPFFFKTVLDTFILTSDPQIKKQLAPAFLHAQRWTLMAYNGDQVYDSCNQRKDSNQAYMRTLRTLGPAETRNCAEFGKKTKPTPIGRNSLRGMVMTKEAMKEEPVHYAKNIVASRKIIKSRLEKYDFLPPKTHNVKQTPSHRNPWLTYV